MANVDPLFKRSAKAEADAMKNLGMTAAQIEARGGISASGYYGDSWSSKANLSDAEYALAAQGGGAGVNAATEALRTKNGITPTPVSAPAPVVKPVVDSAVANLQSQFNDFLAKQNEANAIANTAKLAKRESAITVMTERLKAYHLESLAPIMLSLAQQDAGEDTIMLQLSETPEYKERFKANKTRIAKGLAVLTPKEYLATEDSHRQVLRAAGLTRFDNDAYVGQFMENDMSPNELSSRIDLAVNRVQNGDPDTMEQLRLYGLDAVDMVSYMLDPKQVLPDIERKVATAEIGAAGRKNDLYVSAGTAGDLAAKGITKAQAESGYSTIAGILPDAKRLSDIYGGVQSKYDLGTAESEVFGQLASAKRAREALIRSEQGTFSASSGTFKGSLSGPKL